MIDYSKEGFEENIYDADLVLDTIGGETLERSWSVLRRGGVLISLVEKPPAEKAAAYGVRGVFFVVEPNRNELIEIARLIDSGLLWPVIAGVLPLERARVAFERGTGGHTRGKLVLSIAAPAAATA